MNTIGLTFTNPENSGCNNFRLEHNVTSGNLFIDTEIDYLFQKEFSIF